MCKDVCRTQKAMCEEGGLERERAVKEGVLVSKRAPSQCSLKYRAHGMNAGHKCGMKPCMAPHASKPHLGIQGRRTTSSRIAWPEQHNRGSMARQG